MKKIVYLATVFAFVAISSCTKEEPASPVTDNRNRVEFEVCNTLTRTSLAENGTDVLWNPGDVISVYDAESKKGSEFTTNITNDAATAMFSGNAAPFNGVMYFAALGNFGNWHSFNEPRFNLRPFQTAVKGTFDPAVNMAVAKTTASEKKLRFSNVVALIKFTVSENGDRINKVCLKSFQDKGFVTGTMTYNIATNKINAEKNSVLKEITLKREDGANFEPGDYYIGLLPGYHEMGLEFNFTNANNSKTARKILIKAKNAEPGKIYNVGVIKNLLWQ